MVDGDGWESREERKGTGGYDVAKWGCFSRKGNKLFHVQVYVVIL